MDKDQRRRQYFAVKEQLTGAEKELIAYYELQWFLRQNVPTIEEVTQHLRKKNPGASQIAVNHYLTRRPVIKALEKRGIPFRQHTQENLTATQVAAAVTMMNFADTRSNDDKLAQLGILPATYYAWLNDPQFKQLVDTLSEQNLKNINPVAIGEFTKLINQGKWDAIKYYLDVTGAVKNTDQPQTEHLLRVFVEVIQRHVKDPEVIVAIAKDLKLAAANRTLEVVANPEITSYVVEDDQELDYARKQLGV